jgi:hypothetical protein
MPDECTEPTQGSFWPELVSSKPRRSPASSLPAARTCKQCEQRLPVAAGRRLYCSPACRELARPSQRAALGAQDTRAQSFPDGPDVSGPIPGPLASEPPAARSSGEELSAQRRLLLACQLLSAYRPAALWQALEPEEQTQAAATIRSLYQWVRDLEPFARRHRGT